MADVANTVVLVHGAWHGGWCWEKVIPLLEAAGVDSVAVDLPLTSLREDADATRTALDAVPGEAVLCGHSYGGAVITEAGHHPAVAHLAYLTAFACDEGESPAATATDADVPATDLVEAFVLDDGWATLTRDGAIRGCTTTARRTTSRPRSAGCGRSTSTASGHRSVPRRGGRSRRRTWCARTTRASTPRCSGSWPLGAQRPSSGRPPIRRSSTGLISWPTS
jgi:pimeloyl-ACP methyl ester carboxylesterase